jgi:hypothetical protein
MRISSLLKTRILFILVAVFALATICVLADLTPAQIENGKKATALVQINSKASSPGRGSSPMGMSPPEKIGRANGIAFCINPEGWFVTSKHLTDKSLPGKLNLILNAGEKDQIMLEARVIRNDSNKDLALLKVNNQPPFAALKLGSVEGLAETARLTMFGYPSGENIALEENTFPAISISTGTVASLQRKNGKPEIIGLGASLNPGFLGGPVLNSEGLVIGIVKAWREGAAPQQAIPVNQLQEFLSTPDVDFIPPYLTPLNVRRPATYKASLLDITGNEEDCQVELTLTYSGDQRKVLMKRGSDGLFAGEVTLPPPKSFGSLLLSANFGNNSVSGTVENQSFTIAGTTYQLNKVRRLEGGEKPSAVFDDKTTVEGTINGLSSVIVNMGEMRVTLDLTKASSVTLQPLGNNSYVEYKIDINRNGKTANSKHGVIPLR